MKKSELRMLIKEELAKNIELDELKNIGLDDLREMGYEYGKKLFEEIQSTQHEFKNRIDFKAFKDGLIQGLIDTAHSQIL